MASRGGLIGVGGFGGTSSISHEEEIHDLFSGLCFELCDSCDDNTFLWVISEIKIARCGYKEVSDHFVVDFDVGNEHVVLIIFVFVDAMEDISDGKNTKDKNCAT